MKYYLVLLGIILFACASQPVGPGNNIPAFKQVEPSIYRGGQPTSLSDYQYLKSVGVKNVLKLNSDSENDENSWAASTGMNIMYIPLSGLFEPSTGDMNRIESILADSTEQPLYVHCLHGEDRTGLAIGLYRVKHEGWTAQAAHDEMTNLGFHTILIGLEHYFWENAKN